jgi:pimeloyl-ACP methyl ester carboxylesterase
MARVSQTLGVLAGTLALIASACAQSSSSHPSSVSQSAHRSPSGAHGDFAGLVDIGGRRVFLECHGSGSPTVILQSGSGNAADAWNFAEAHPPAEAPGVARFTRECAYDRPGTLRALTDAGVPAPSRLAGRSDPAPMPRTATDVATELHTLLAKAGVPGPYIMASHSLGGLFSLLYARTYPDQVTGLVMIDATTPQMMNVLGPQQWEQYQQQALHLPNVVPGYQIEQFDLTASVKQIEGAPPLRAMPVTVLLGDTLEPANPQNTLFLALREAGRQFAASVPGARLTTVPNTTHDLPTQRPDVVIAAIRSMIP